MNRKKYPPKEGWIQITFEMSTKKPRSDEDIKKMAAFCSSGRYTTDGHEFAVVEQHGAEIKVVMRKKRALEEASCLPAELFYRMHSARGRKHEIALQRIHAICASRRGAREEAA